jgi:HK97 family phage major capsid protein
MPLTTGTTGPLLTPEQVESLLINPFSRASTALRPSFSRVLRPTASSIRLPAMTADPTAAWVAEGAGIPISDLSTAEVDVVTPKVAGRPWSPPRWRSETVPYLLGGRNGGCQPDCTRVPEVGP